MAPPRIGHPTKAQREQEKRAAKFSLKQASLPVSQQLQNRTDLQDVSHKRYAFRTIQWHLAVRRYWQEYMQFTFPTEYQPAYFDTVGPVASVERIKGFAVYLAQTRTGTIESTVTLQYVTSVVRLLCALMQRYRRVDISKADRQNIFAFISNDLATQEGLTTAMKPKPLCMSEDLELMLAKLFSRSYLSTFPTMRCVLNLSLFINLMVDCAGRGGDIAHDPSNGNVVEFAWKDVDIYAFPIGDGVEFTAKLRFRYLKGMKFNDSQYKEVIVSMRSTHLANQDSLRQLLILALMDGVFANNITSWEQLQRLTPMETGTRVLIKPESSKLPVLRRFTRQDDRVADQPEAVANLRIQVRRLGVACGFEIRLTAYAIRRGLAYMLDQEVSEDNRKFIMGHKSNSRVWSSYMSRVSKVDARSIFVGEKPKDHRAMQRISLNRKEDAPRTVSATGYDAIMQSEAYLDIARVSEKLANQLREKHGSLAAASRTADPAFAEYKSSENARQATRQTLMKVKFKEEHDAFFITAQSPLTSSKKLLPGVELDKEVDPAEIDDVENGDEGEDVDIPIDPELERAVEKATRESDEQLMGVVDEIASSPSNTGSSIDNVNAIEEVSPRLHGLPKRPYQGAQNNFASRYYVGTGVCEGLDHILTSGSLTEAELSTALIECFSVMHAVDAFAPGDEPFPGTYCCRYCDEPLNHLQQTTGHVKACSRQNALQQATADIEAHCPFNQPCPFQYPAGKKSAAVGGFRTCGEIMKDRGSCSQHHFDHIKNAQYPKDAVTNEKLLHCFYAGCATDTTKRRKDAVGRRTDPAFDSLEDLKLHLAQVHRVWAVKVGYGKEHAPRTSLVEPQWCQYCEVWLSPFEDHKIHAAQHVFDAVEYIKASGYEGITASFVTIRPTHQIISVLVITIIFLNISRRRIGN